MIESSRRSFLAGLGALLAAPAVVRVEALMPVRLPAGLRPINPYLTIDEITRAAIKLFAESNEFLRQINEQCRDDFAFMSGEQWTIGSQLRIRLPNNYALQ